MKCFLLDGGVAEDSKPSSSVFLIAESFNETISVRLRALETSGMATGDVIDAVLMGGIILGLTGLELRDVFVCAATFCGVELDRRLDAASTLVTAAGTAVPQLGTCAPFTGDPPAVLAGTAAKLPLLFRPLIISSLLPGPMLTLNFLSVSFLRGEFDDTLARALRGLVDGLFFLLSEPFVLAKFNGVIWTTLILFFVLRGDFVDSEPSREVSKSLSLDVELISGQNCLIALY